MLVPACRELDLMHTMIDTDQLTATHIPWILNYIVEYFMS